MMKRWLYASELLACPAEAAEPVLVHQIRPLLQRATGAEPAAPDGDGTFLVELPSRLLHRDVARTVRVTVGAAHRSRNRLILPLDWRAEAAPSAFATFSGTVELEPVDAARARLTIVGSYEPPVGVLGAAVDAVVLSPVAQHTADALVRALASALVAEVRAPAGEQDERPARGAALRVADVMTADPLVVDEGQPVRTAALLLFRAGISGAPVVAADGRLVGVISDRDLLVLEAAHRPDGGHLVAADERRRRAPTVGEACSAPARVTAPDAPLAAAARQMLDQDVRRLVVLDGGELVGVVTRHDVLAALLRDDAELESAARRLLDSQGVADRVRVEVQGGQARMAGTVEHRSLARRLASLLGEVDGITGVDTGELAWEIDDELPIMLN